MTQRTKEEKKRGRRSSGGVRSSSQTLQLPPGARRGPAHHHQSFLSSHQGQTSHQIHLSTGSRTCPPSPHRPPHDGRGLLSADNRWVSGLLLTFTFPPIRSGGSSSVSKATLMVAKGRLAICCISLSSCYGEEEKARSGMDRTTHPCRQTSIH